MKYEIKGNTMPIVSCVLESGEQMITEKGSMAWMSPNMKMETTATGGVKKALGRMFSGDSFFQNIYTAQGGPGTITFASSFPGSIVPIDVGRDEIIAQKSAFLAGEESVKLSVHFRKKLSEGLFGGEGFIMQKLSGQGMAFLEIDGEAIAYNLKEGQSIVIDTGHLAYMSATCSMEIVSVKGAKNILFGGEGLFHTVVSGPGKVVLQTMPISNVAGALVQYMPTNNG